MGTFHRCVVFTLMCGLISSAVDTNTTNNNNNKDDNNDRVKAVRWRDSISMRMLKDGLRQLRIAFRGMLVMETSQLPRSALTLTKNNTDPQYVHNVTRLLQVTDGRRLVQTVLRGNLMTECSTSRDSRDVMRFMDEFLHAHPSRAAPGDVFQAYNDTERSSFDSAADFGNKNSSAGIFPRSTDHLISSSQRSNSSLHFDASDRQLSGDSHRSGRHRHRHDTKSGRRFHFRRGVSMHLRGLHSLDGFARYLNIRQQVNECVKFDSLARAQLRAAPILNADGGDDEVRNVPPQSVSGDSVPAGSVPTQSVPENIVSEQTVQAHSAKSQQSGHSRQKRDLLSGWFIFPGTKWCGDGDIAEHGNDLGYDEALDACCREHDKCPNVIPRVSWKYSLFNYRLHTLSHCKCDRRFRKCLKASSSPSAHMVGKIYFNVIGPQCFKFTKSKTCKRRNWWGKCERYGFTKTAYPKTQKYF